MPKRTMCSPIYVGCADGATARFVLLELAVGGLEGMSWPRQGEQRRRGIAGERRVVGAGKQNEKTEDGPGSREVGMEEGEKTERYARGAGSEEEARKARDERPLWLEGKRDETVKGTGTRPTHKQVQEPDIQGRRPCTTEPGKAAVQKGEDEAGIERRRRREDKGRRTN